MRALRPVAGLALSLCLCAGTARTPERLDEDAVRIRAVCLFYGIDEAFVRAGRRLENGRPGYEFGAQPLVLRSVYGIACLPEGSGQYAAWAMGHIRAMECFIFSDQWKRREYFKWFAKYWHSGTRDANEVYRKELFELWLEERAKLYDREHRGGYNPAVSGTVLR